MYTLLVLLDAGLFSQSIATYRNFCNITDFLEVPSRKKRKLKNINKFSGEVLQMGHTKIPDRHFHTFIALAGGFQLLLSICMETRPLSPLETREEEHFKVMVVLLFNFGKSWKSHGILHQGHSRKPELKHTKPHAL